MSSPLVLPTRGCSSSPSTVSSAHFWMYSCARCTGFRVWNPTTRVQPRSAKAARVSFGSRWCEGHARMGVLGGAVRLGRLVLAVDREHLLDVEHPEQLTVGALERHPVTGRRL